VPPDTDETAFELRLPKVQGRAADNVRPTRILSLTGGGYRGLFTSGVLVELGRLAREEGPLDRRFDVFGGTSIGGLMACALATGVPPRRVVEAIEAHGPRIFTPRFGDRAKRLVAGPIYDPAGLRLAIDECLGPNAETAIGDVDVAIVVPAVDWESGVARIFTSKPLGAAHARATSLRDVCLATSAAPTYFPAHEIEGSSLLDGGLTANNPDTLILLEVARRWPDLSWSKVEMLSIGTAGADAPRAAGEANKSLIGWSGQIVDYILAVQERTASLQASALLGPERYLRVNHVPPTGDDVFARLDLADDRSRRTLGAAAKTVAARAYAANQHFIDRVLAQRD
jgi:predicted acylesterase/phospholipase RssA